MSLLEQAAKKKEEGVVYRDFYRSNSLDKKRWLTKEVFDRIKQIFKVKK